MLNRLASYGCGPIESCNQTSTPQVPVIDLERELKMGVEYICEFNKKLSSLSWQAREIINGWLQDVKRF